LAVKALKNKLVKKIILTRPAVEAGENLGFLPGMLPPEKLEHFISTRVIEVAPLAFMRGRTLDNAFIILDEAQNTTSTQIKMFLTRIGPTARCIITGDLSQVDLPYSQKSGLRRAIELLTPLDGIGVVYLNAEDVVRHRLVKEIIKAYNRSDELRREEKLKAEEEKKARRTAWNNRREDHQDRE